MSYITPIKFLRSLIYNKRPNPATLLEGQPAYNSNVDQPGLFFKNSDNLLTKIGPVFVGDVPPNDPADPNGAGSGSLSVGEQWLDTSGTYGAILKTWTGAEWAESTPFTYARALIQTTTPATTFPPGTLWWHSGTGVTRILHNSAWVVIAP